MSKPTTTLEAVIGKLEANRERLGIELNPPATEADIQQLERALGRPLPPDIAAFYRYCNGFETEDDMFRLVSLEDAIGFSNNTLALHRFVVAEFCIRCDVWEVVLDAESGEGYRIVNDVYGQETEVTLTTSLSQFISRYLDGENVYALYDWYQQEKQKRTSLGSV